MELLPIHVSENILEHASGAFVFFTRSRAEIKFVLQAASALASTDLEQRALCKYFRSIRIKIPEISVGSQMERIISVCSDRNIRDHLLIGRTENYRSILLNRLISRFPSVDFSYNGDWGNPYQIKEQKKVRVIQPSVGPV